jgi:hypothetical protein
MELRHIQINAATSGYTATDLNAGRGNRTVEEGTRAIVAMATLDDTAPPERSSTRISALVSAPTAGPDT